MPDSSDVSNPESIKNPVKNTVVPKDANEVLVDVQQRENLIKSAVNFLLSPAVQTKPLDKQIAFLKSKGLTDVEVQAACERASLQQAAILQPMTENSSLISLLKRYSTLTLVVGGVVYAIYAFYKRFIYPYFARFWEERDKRMEKLEVHINTTSVLTQSLKSDVQRLSVSLEQISVSIDELRLSTKESSVLADAKVKPIYDQLAKLKSLTLGSKQFPPKPKVLGWNSTNEDLKLAVSSSEELSKQKTTIPSWQLESQKKQMLDTDKESADAPSFGVTSLDNKESLNNLSSSEITINENNLDDKISVMAESSLPSQGSITDKNTLIESEDSELESIAVGNVTKKLVESVENVTFSE